MRKIMQEQGPETKICTRDKYVSTLKKNAFN